jgi:hypothetical protein
MDTANMIIGRRTAILGSLAFGATALLAGPLNAAVLSGGSIKSMLGNASDGALDKLGKPGAFYADTAVRILLPGTTGKLASRIIRTGDKLGLTKKLTTSLNDAAGLAALEAKPVFRKAVDGLSITDVPGIVVKSDGATQYLKQSVGPDLRIKVRPLIVAALTKVGAFTQLERLGKTTGGLLGLAKLNGDGLSDSVTDQALKGIYSYMGKEESSLRGNLSGIGKAIGDIIK